MRHLYLVLTLLAVIADGQPVNKDQALVDFINSQNKWVARQNSRFMDLDKLKQLMGSNEGFNSKNILNITDSGDKTDELPKEFDARTNWPECADIIGRVTDQSECGSCYAVSSAAVMSDRLCIASSGQIKISVSAADIMSCCKECGFGCQGVPILCWPDEVFDEWSNGGFVTGGDFVKDDGCRPYTFAPCQHYHMYYANSSLPVCPSTYYTSPNCVRKCQQSYTINYEDDKFYGQRQVATFQDVASIQREIMTNGPVVATYAVYDDFAKYASGIYEKMSNTFIGFHAVRIIGWGEDNSTNVTIPYWLVVNSWNSDWGENGGMFRIKRGSNEAGIERSVVAALPDINRSAKLFVF